MKSQKSPPCSMSLDEDSRLLPDVAGIAVDSFAGPPNASVRTLRSRRRARPSASTRPTRDPLHWWRTRAAQSFDDLDLKILVLLLDRYSLTRPNWRDVLSGVSADTIDHLARHRFPSPNRDLLMTSLLRSALAGDRDASRFLIAELRRHGLGDLANSWRHVRLGPRHIALRRPNAKAHRRPPGRNSSKSKRQAPNDD